MISFSCGEARDEVLVPHGCGQYSWAMRCGHWMTNVSLQCSRLWLRLLLAGLSRSEKDHKIRPSLLCIRPSPVVGGIKAARQPTQHCPQKHRVSLRQRRICTFRQSFRHPLFFLPRQTNRHHVLARYGAATPPPPPLSPAAGRWKS